MSESILLSKSQGKRERSKAANRQSILDAGRAVFARVGFEAATVRDIIRETELAPGTFYNYFKSKEDVFEAIAEDSAHRFRQVLQEVRAQATGLETYVRDGLRAYFQFLYSENCEAIESGVPHMALLGVRVDTPEMKAIFNEIRSDLERILEDTERLSVDTEYLTAAIVGIAREMGDHMLQRRPIDVAATVEFASRVLLAGASDMISERG